MPGQGLAARAHPTAPAKSRAVQGAAPDLGIWHLSGDRLRPGQAVGLWVGPAWQGPWLGRAGLWRGGDQHCCGIAGAGTNGPSTVGWDQSGLVRAVGACRPWHTPWCTGRGLWASHSRGMAPTSHLHSSEVSFAPFISFLFPRRCQGTVSSVPFPPSQPSPCASYIFGGFFCSQEVNPSSHLLAYPCGAVAGAAPKNLGSSRYPLLSFCKNKDVNCIRDVLN